jgi:hypothetical protein
MPPEQQAGGVFLDAGSRSSGGMGFDDDDGHAARREVSSSLKGDTSIIVESVASSWFRICGRMVERLDFYMVLLLFLCFFGVAEPTVRVETKGGSCSGSAGTDQMPNTPRSKHSATEQRRRSKINDRLVAWSLQSIQKKRSYSLYCCSATLLI